MRQGRPSGGRSLVLILLAMLLIFAVIIAISVWAAAK
jgi:hypothetical protein